MDKEQIGRLALRVEGSWWVAYYAEPDTMDGAQELARIRMRLVQDQKRKHAFMGLMRDMVADLLQEFTGGVRPDWDEPQTAPEGERSGHA